MPEQSHGAVARLSFSPIPFGNDDGTVWKRAESGIAIIVSIMAARVTLKAVNDELSRRGHQARLEKGSGYFYFWSEDSADWIDRTVRVATLNSLTLDQWVGEYLWLKKVNAERTQPGRVKPWINLDARKPSPLK